MPDKNSLSRRVFFFVLRLGCTGFIALLFWAVSIHAAIIDSKIENAKFILDQNQSMISVMDQSILEQNITPSVLYSTIAEHFGAYLHHWSLGSLKHIEPKNQLGNSAFYFEPIDSSQTICINSSCYFSFFQEYKRQKNTLQIYQRQLELYKNHYGEYPEAHDYNQLYQEMIQEVGFWPKIDLNLGWSLDVQISKLHYSLLLNRASETITCSEQYVCQYQYEK